MQLITIVSPIIIIVSLVFSLYARQCPGDVEFVFRHSKQLQLYFISRPVSPSTVPADTQLVLPVSFAHYYSVTTILPVSFWVEVMKVITNRLPLGNASPFNFKVATFNSAAAIPVTLLTGCAGFHSGPEGCEIVWYIGYCSIGDFQSRTH